VPELQVVGPPSPIRLAVQIEATRAEAAALLWQLAVVDAGLADALLGFRQVTRHGHRPGKTEVARH
jgi:hypothetical protein